MISSLKSDLVDARSHPEEAKGPPSLPADKALCVEQPDIASNGHDPARKLRRIVRFPIDQKRSYHAVIILDFSEKSVAFLDPLVIGSIPPGERTIERKNSTRSISSRWFVTGPCESNACI